MAPKNRTSDPSAEVKSLLEKILILRLSEMGVPQSIIAKKLGVGIGTVNDFLKGVKKANVKKEEK
jgi:hypothetical protein